MEAQEGGSVAFGIMPAQRESVILRDLPARVSRPEMVSESWLILSI
jgi:hypothetical protein